MNWNYREDLPIYPQLVDLLKRAIISGELAPGSRLQSVREMAMDAGVNPNTMQRALADLEEKGMVFTQRTSGRFVTEDRELIRKAGEEQASEIAAAYLRSMKELGYSPKEAEELLHQTVQLLGQ